MKKIYEEPNLEITKFEFNYYLLASGDTDDTLPEEEKPTNNGEDFEDVFG